MSVTERPTVSILIIMPPPLTGGDIKRRCCLTSVWFWRLSVWRLCVCRVRTSGLSWEQRGLKLAQVAQVTNDSDTTFKVKRSKVKAALVACSSHNLHLWTTTTVYATAQSERLSTLGRGHMWRPPAYSLFWIIVDFTAANNTKPVKSFSAT